MKWIAITTLLLTMPILPRADILSVHCPAGCPTNPDGNDLVFGHLYALSNNPTTKFSDWVAYEVDVTNFGASPGRNWKEDPLLDESKTLEPSDYKKANRELKIDRGHQAPLASFAGSKYWSELNYLSNITPQKSALNQGPWKDLEGAVRSATGFRNSLYVIAGPIYSDDYGVLPRADEPHKIPAGYFKIIYSANGESAAFFMSQAEDRNADYCTLKKPVPEIQAMLSFSLPALSDYRTIIERLGCTNNGEDILLD